MFGGGQSFQLMRIFGIRIGASPSWFVVLFVFIYLMSEQFKNVLDGSSTQAYLVAVAAVFLFFASIVLHELGHAVVARRLGIGISGIDLWFFGGIAKMTSDSTSPGTEFKIAAAGPLVTLGIVGLCTGLVAAISGDPVLDVILFASNVHISPGLALLGFLAFINGVVFVFNMIPAFPLDGGRIARAILWQVTGNRTRATRIAGRLGEGFAYLVVGYGIFLAASGSTVSGIWFAVLGWFIAQAARSAVASSQLTERIEGITAADIMDAEPVAMPADIELARAEDEYFLRYGWDWFPVVDSQGRFMGIVRKERVAAEIQAGRPALDVGEIVELADADGWRVPSDSTLQRLLGDERLRDKRALMVVDGDGVLRGVVTIEQVSRAVTSALPRSARGAT